jgi:hypothetical protein
MGAYQAFIELGFDARLRKSGGATYVEVVLFKKLLADYGLDAAVVPNYSVTTDIVLGESGDEARRTVWLKGQGSWITVVLETRAPGVFIIHER